MSTPGEDAIFNNWGKNTGLDAPTAGFNFSRQGRCCLRLDVQKSLIPTLSLLIPSVFSHII